MRTLVLRLGEVEAFATAVARVGQLPSRDAVHEGASILAVVDESRAGPLVAVKVAHEGLCLDGICLWALQDRERLPSGFILREAAEVGPSIVDLSAGEQASWFRAQDTAPPDA